MDTFETGDNFVGIEEAGEIARELAWMYAFLTDVCAQTRIIIIIVIKCMFYSLQ